MTDSTVEALVNVLIEYCPSPTKGGFAYTTGHQPETVIEALLDSGLIVDHLKYHEALFRANRAEKAVERVSEEIPRWGTQRSRDALFRALAGGDRP